MRPGRTVAPLIALLAALCAAAPSSSAGPKNKKKLAAVTGIITAVDAEGGSITLEHKLKAAAIPLTFKVTAKTRIYWSKASMKVTLGSISPGLRVVVQFYQEGAASVATKIVLPGGMKEVADAIMKGLFKEGDKK